MVGESTPNSLCQVFLLNIMLFEAWVVFHSPKNSVLFLFFKKCSNFSKDCGATVHEASPELVWISINVHFSWTIPLYTSQLPRQICIVYWKRKPWEKQNTSEENIKEKKYDHHRHIPVILQNADKVMFLPLFFQIILTWNYYLSQDFRFCITSSNLNLGVNLPF